MSSDINLLDLPDLILIKICSSISCPFDLINFGSSCSRLYHLSSSSHLWWHLAFHWLRGLWSLFEEGSAEENPRKWMIKVMSLYSAKSKRTKHICTFANGEQWIRVDTPKFRFLFNLLCLSYSKYKVDHPAILYEAWLYDIGIYKRVNSCLDFAADNFTFDEDIIAQFSSLGQASDRDLRRRKQPFKDHKYYIKKIGSSDKSWKIDLFPVSVSGSTCPLLLCPFKNDASFELSGVQGLAMCLSIVCENHIQKFYSPVTLTLPKICESIKLLCTAFVSLMAPFIAPNNKISVTSFFSLVEQNRYDYDSLQLIIQNLNLNLNAKDIVIDLVKLLKKYERLDFLVDQLRLRLRESISDEVSDILFPPNAERRTVTRINLTDSDLIGGDNAKQEMSAAAFISDHGALTTWHLIGRMRF